MPAKSKAQQRLMGVAYAVKKGDMQLSDVDASYKDEVKDLVDNMSLKSLKKYAATKHEGLPERVPENIQPGQINGMGPVVLPADGLLGSGDVPAGRGDAEEEYKKKKKKMSNFEEFVNGLNKPNVDEAYGGTASDFKYEFPNQFEDVTGFSDKAIKGIRKKGKNGYEVRTSTYAGKEYMEAVGKQMGLEIKKFEKHSNMCITVYESVDSTVNEWGSSDQSIMNKTIHNDAGKPKQMPSPFDKKLRDAAESAVDFYWDDWEEYETDRDGLIDDAVRGYLRQYFKKDFEMMQRMFEPMESVQVTEGVLSDVRKAVEKTKKTLKKKWATKGGYENFGQDEISDLQDKYDYDGMVYGTPEERKAAKLIDGLDQWAMNYVGESEVQVTEDSVVSEIRMSSWGELAYTEDQVNTKFGWCGTLAHELGEDKAMFLTHQSIHELQQRALGLTVWEALAILNSTAGRHAAEAYLGGESAASDALSALIWYFGSKSSVAKHAKQERKLQFPSKK